MVNTSWRASEWWVEHRPSAHLLHGPYYFFFERQKYLGDKYVWFRQDFNEQEWTSLPKKSDAFNASLPTFRRVLDRLDSHPLNAPLQRTLLLVNEGMMSGQLPFRLMRFWSAAEALYSREGSRTSTDSIIERMIFSEKEEHAFVERSKLKRAYALRNQYVHKGAIEKNDSALIHNLRETILRLAYYVLFNGDDFETHSDLIEMMEPKNAPHRTERKLMAIERRKRLVETGRHRQ